MFDIQNYTGFLAAIIVFQMIPGAGTLAILNATARNGVGAGLGAVFGTLFGDFLFMVATVAGLAAVMKANPICFQALQWFVYQTGLVLVGNAVARCLRAIPSVRRIATRLAGIALIGFGVKLATGNR